MSDKDLSELYNRLRETEAQTREQNERINALTGRVDAIMQKWDTHMDKMWKLVYIAVGALIALGIGPKALDKIKDSILAGDMPVSYSQPIFPAPGNDYHSNKLVNA